MLMELGYQFDFIDSTLDFDKYRLLILPDVIPVDEELRDKLSTYLKKGGKLLVSYQSGLDRAHQKFMIPELAVVYRGEAPYSPDFIWPKEHLSKDLADAEHVMYDKGTLVEATDEAVFVQKVIPPVFNRTYEHFCSHLHSPSGRKEAYPGIVETENTAYFIHPIFTTYQNWAPAWFKKLFRNELERLLPDPIIQHNGPSTTQVTVLEQNQENRKIVHVLHYVPVKKCKNLEIVEDVIPLYNLKITMNEERKVRDIYTVPDRQKIVYEQNGSELDFTVKEVNGHQMIAICYES